MAEPLRKDPYDRKFGEEDEQAVSGPDLRAIEGGGETTEPRRGHLSVAGKEKSKSPEELDEAEKSGGLPKPDDASEDEQSRLGETERQIGEGYQGGKNKSRSKFMSKFSGWSKRKKLLVGIGGGGGITGIIVALMFSILPLKILHIITNVQSWGFGSSENAVEQRVDNLFDTYMKRHVLKGLTGSGACVSTRTIDKNCIAEIPGDSMASRLFRGWREVQFEKGLANNYGIEISKNPQNNRFTLKVPGSPDIDFDETFLSDNTRTISDLDARGSRRQLKASLNEALEGESRWKRVFYRIKVGRFAERKYAIRRCVFVCKVTDARDQFDSWKDRKKTAAKLQVARRVVLPKNQNLAIALECIFSGECVSDPKPDGPDNERRDATEKKIAKVLEDNGFQIITEQVDDIAKLVQEIVDSGSITKYLATKLFGEVFSKYAAKAERAIPVVGWIITASQVIDTISKAPKQVKRWTFAMNSAAMVGTFVLWRAQADEAKNGQADSELLGSMVSALGDTANGKGQTAELSPLYGDILGTSSTKTSLLDFISPSAYAQSEVSESPRYTCDDGSPIQSGELVCPEEKLEASGFWGALEDFFNTPPFNLIAGAASAITGAIRDATGIFCKIPGVCNIGEILIGLIPGPLKNAIADLTGPLMEKLATFLIPSPVSPDMSGARAFNMIAGGADAMGNDYAHYGLGGQRLSFQQSADIRNLQESKARERFANQPFFARMFDTDTPYSFTSRVALALPNGYSTVGSSSFSSLVSNPFAKLIDGFGSLFGGRRGFAQSTADPFGIPQFGYPLNAETEQIIKQNPDIYTDEYCAQVNKDWAAGEGQFAGTLEIDEETGIDIHTRPNPCLLEASAVAAAGGYFTDEVFNKLDLSDPTPTAAATGGNNTGGGSGTASSCTLSRTQMVEQILGHQGGLLRLQNAGAQADQIQDPSKTTDRLICMLWSVLEQGKFKVSIGSIYRPNSGGSLHQQGRAIDFGDAGTEDPPGLFKWLYENKETLAIDELIFDPIPPGTNLVDQGNDCSTCYDQATLNAHRDHVHAGVLP